MGGRAAIVVAVLALAAAGAAAAGAAGLIDIGEPLHASFRFQMTPSKLPRAKAKPVRVSISGRYRTDDGSHVPALHELKLEFDRHFILDVKDVPVCGGGAINVRRNVLEGCEDAVVGRGTVEAEVAFPEQPLTSVSGALTVYNRGRKPGGADLLGWAYFSAPITGAVVVPVKVRRIDGGRYGWRARLEIPKLAGGSGSITGYSVRFLDRILSATCGDGRLQIGGVSTFVDGTLLASSVIRSCFVPEAHPRQ